MVTNPTEASSGQSQVLLVIEDTAANGAYINELYNNYIVPTLEYFHGNNIDDGGGGGNTFGVITYKSADCFPGMPVVTYGPFMDPKRVCNTIEKLKFMGGRNEHRACMAEALTTAWSCFEEIGQNDFPRHVVLICCSPPYTAMGGGLVPPGAPLGGTIESVARGLNERGIHVSVIAGRRTPALLALYEQAGGELVAAQQRNYAKDPRHLVLLRGYSLKERPPSPAPPPVPEIQTDLYGGTPTRSAVQNVVPVVAAQVAVNQVVGQVSVGQLPVPGGQVAVGQVPGQVPVGQVGPRPQFGRGAVRANWLHTTQRPLYANNSALLTQLAQPSYPPPAQPQQRLPLLSQPGPSPSAAQASQLSQSSTVAQSPATSTSAPGPAQRTYFWSGVLEWMEKGKASGDQKITKLLPCQVSANSKELEPDFKADTWPNKLLMQLMPKQLISNIGGQYLKDSKSVLFHLQQNEALDALTKVLVNGFAGCVHFSPMTPAQCDIKVLILLYTPDKNAYLGFIPNNQTTFVERLKKVIQQQKMSQIINKQGPASGSPSNPMGGSGAMVPSGSVGPSGSMGPAPSMVPSSSMGQSSNMGTTSSMGPGVGGAGLGTGGQMQPNPSMVSQQHPQPNMMISGNMAGVNQTLKGGRVTQLDGLEAARQQNLEKIHQLQQTLEAAHQQEAQFKSQMDIMNNLHAAQQQEQHFKQLEEQQRKHQLQQQLQQQLRGAGAQHAPRIMRPMISSNPGLRHLLQQQQQQPRGPRPHM